jgi:protein-L-isoaspartate(D-aspartate) O-methyltransferase
MPDYAAARKAMVENQLRPNRIDNPRVIEAMSLVPRELFVPKALRGVAYGDQDLEFGDGRRLIEPLALGKLLQACEIGARDVVLIIGCDTGYVAAVVSRLAATVFLLVPAEEPTGSIDRLLGELNCDNVVVQSGAGAEGLKSQAPFDVILLAGSIQKIPQVLLDQLGQGGRLAAVVQERHAGRVTICRKVGDSVGSWTPYDAWIPELVALRAPPSFTF